MFPVCFRVSPLGAKHNGKGKCDFQDGRAIDYSVLPWCKTNSKSTGTITDLDGNFTISVPKNASLAISYIGYKEVIIAAKPSLKVVMEEDSKMIDEVVVTGYMAEKKASLTGSVAVVKMKEVADIPTGNVMSGLQGRVAGMNVTTDGKPGGGNHGY